jgi:hypothetical protein
MQCASVAYRQSDMSCRQQYDWYNKNTINVPVGDSGYVWYDRVSG